MRAWSGMKPDPIPTATVIYDDTAAGSSQEVGEAILGSVNLFFNSKKSLTAQKPGLEITVFLSSGERRKFKAGKEVTN